MTETVPRPGEFTVIVTSDRYGNETRGLELEQELAAAVTDLDVKLLGRASTTEDELIRVAQDADALLVSTREAVDSPRAGADPACESHLSLRRGIGQCRS
jgi:hypothetical protein